MTVRKYSPIRAEVHHLIMTALEFGLFIRWQEEGLPYVALLDYRSLQDHNSMKKGNFKQILLSLIFYAVGIIVGTASMMQEMLRPKWEGKRMRKPNMVNFD